ncbi:MAG: hypothetical protein NT062_34735 [Proteobacteria bacterium]|nr:hypothetical protein [Pseudomonadota bacterium]
MIALAAAAVYAAATCHVAGQQRIPPATYAEARAVVDRRCVPCHARRPSNRAFPIPPRGIVLENAEDLARNAERVRVRAVVERTMPLANLSGMTQEERDILGSWIESSAAIR